MKRYAIVIGIDVYADLRIVPLEVAVADATELADVLVVLAYVGGLFFVSLIDFLMM